MEATLAGKLSARDSIPLTVAVGHTSPLISAGIAATLGRMPGCDVTLRKIAPADATCPENAQVVFGDLALLRRLRGKSIRATTGRIQPECTSPKFVLVAAGDDPLAHASKAAGEIDEHLPITCPESELFNVCRRLIGVGSLISSRAVPAGNGARSAQPHPIAGSDRIDPETERGAADLAHDGGAQRPRPRGGLAPGALRRVREHIDQHFAGHVQTDILAKIAGLSEGHFNRAFRQSTGLSPHRYVLKRRIAVATELLAKTLQPLADIALEVGFADQSHFCRTFAAIAGETPGAWRRRHR